MNYVILPTAYEHELCVFLVTQDEDCELVRGSKVLGYGLDSVHLTKGPHPGPIITGRSVYPKRDSAWASVEDFLSSEFVHEREILFVRRDK